MKLHFFSSPSANTSKAIQIAEYSVSSFFTVIKECDLYDG